MKPAWKGVFPALTTQFHQDQTLDLDATARHIEVVIDSGVSGLVMLGSLGENTALWDLATSGQWEKAREIYRWYMPLLHLDIPIKFVQYIKLCIQECGLGSEWVRAPRLPLEGPEREAVLAIIRRGLETRPDVPARAA